MNNTLKTVALAAACAISSPSAHAALQLISNGGFELGLSGWAVLNQAGSSGDWYAASGASTPLSGHPSVAGASGSFYAVTDQGGSGAHALSQSFTVLPGSLVTLSFAMFVNDWDSGPTIDPAGLDYGAGPNQHARVDILKAGASPLSTSSSDVLANYYLGVDVGPDPHAYTLYSFDVTGVVGGGGIFQIRFGEVDNDFFLNAGVDDVSLLATPFPEPSTYLAGALLLLPFAGSFLRRLRKSPVA